MTLTALIVTSRRTDRSESRGPARLVQRSRASAGRVERLRVLDDPPDLDVGEVTDKGYLNQRRVLDRRAALVERLYTDEPGAAVITG